MASIEATYLKGFGAKLASGPAIVVLGALLLLAEAAHAQAEPGRPGDAARGAPKLGDLGPLERNVEALLDDIARVVDAEESSGWFVDEAAHQSIRPALMESVCRALPEVRRAALERLKQEKERASDPRALYQKDRELTRCVEHALTVSRKVEALNRALPSVERDCPFYIEPSATFVGLQTMRDRFVLTLETGGVLQVRRTRSDWTLGAGGAGRLLAGHNFDAKITLLTGLEFGGGAMLEPNTEPTQFVVNYFPAVPFLFRIHDLAWHFDVELAPVAVFQANNANLSFGGRAAFTVGISALRTRGIIPWAGLGMATEYYLESGGRPQALLIRGGLRVGAVWDP